MGVLPKPCQCSLTGNASGIIRKRCDYFQRATASIEAHICEDCGHVEDSTLTYRVTKHQQSLQLTALPESLKVICPVCFNPDPDRNNPNIIIVAGRGSLVTTLPQGNGTATFFLVVSNGGSSRDFFKMVIIPDDSSAPIHNSGLVTVRSGNLTVGTCQHEICLDKNVSMDELKPFDMIAHYIRADVLTSDPSEEFGFYR